MATVQTDKISSSLLETMNGTTTTTKDSTQEAQDRFMKLLVTQMQNQDPLNPMDNAQVTSQLAQLSTVTGINQLNETLASFMANSQSSQVLQASNMIGHTIMSQSNAMTLKDGEADFAVELPSTADNVTLTIRNTSGVAVRTVEMGRQTSGLLPLTWDGKDSDGKALANGKYTFEVSATSAGKALSVTPYSYNTVSSVSSNATNGVQLHLSNNASIGLDAVKAVY